MARLVLYKPRTGKKERIAEIAELVRDEAKNLKMEYYEKWDDEDSLIVYFEDEESSTFLDVEDDEEENLENIRAMIRVLALISLLSENEKVKERVAKA